MSLPWKIFDPLDEERFSKIRLQMIFKYCKWDPQVGDMPILANFPLVIKAEAWKQVADLAESLARETLAVEQELIFKPNLIKDLGLPRALLKVFKQTRVDNLSPGMARLMRFDFHYTRDGWRVSEVNSDVPGGFNEASGLPLLMMPYYPQTRSPGDPGLHIAQAIKNKLGTEAAIGLVHATAYADDRQVMVYLAEQLKQQGLNPILIAPDHLQWKNGLAVIEQEWYDGPVHGLARFYPGEWLPRLPRSSGWQYYIRGSGIPISNPATALLTQSKRWPLVWDKLDTSLETWKTLLPETCDPQDNRVQKDEDWVFKPVFGRVGEEVGIKGVVTDKEWKAIAKQAVRQHDYWVAQRRFESLPVETDGKAYFPCLGIYTVNERVAGAYGRIGTTPLTNLLAQDIAVLINQE